MPSETKTTTTTTLLQELRVAKVELKSGNTKGNVYIRKSPGSIFWLLPKDRTLTQQHLDVQIQKEISRSFNEEDNKL